MIRANLNAQTHSQVFPAKDVPDRILSTKAQAPLRQALKDIAIFGMRPTDEFRSHVVRHYPQTAVELAAMSPAEIPLDRVEQSRLLLTLFDTDDTISASWYESEWELGHACESREIISYRISEFTLIEPRVITPAVLEFEWGTRDSSPVPEGCFLVVCPPNAEELQKHPDDCASVFVWLTSEYGLKLSAVVRHENALEGWFGGISKSTWESLRQILPKLGICEESAFECKYLAALPTSEDAELIYFAK